MSSLFSGGGSIDIPAGRRSGRARGKFGRMAGEIVKAIGGSSPTVGLAVEPRGTFNPGISDKPKKQLKPVGTFNPGINPPSIDENKSGRIGDFSMMPGGSSPIPGVSGHEYLNNPKYAEHRREYYGKKNKDRPEVKEEDIKKKPLPNIRDRARGRRRRKAVDDAVSFSRRIPNRSEEDRRRNRKRRRGGNIPSGEQQPVGSGYKPFMLGGKVTEEDLSDGVFGTGKDKNKTNMPTFGKMVYT